MTLLGIHISTKINIKVEINVFGASKEEAPKTIQIERELTPAVNYIYTLDQFKAHVDMGISELIKGIKSYFSK